MSILVIKAQRFRNQEQNRDGCPREAERTRHRGQPRSALPGPDEAHERLRQRRLDNKKSRSQTKSLRRPPE